MRVCEADDIPIGRDGQRRYRARVSDLARVLEATGTLTPRAGTTAVVAIDGRSGAGKSTLAAELARRLGAPVVALEDLYGGWDGLETGRRPPRRAVLGPLAAGRAARVPRYDWQRGRVGASRGCWPCRDC